jgi:putative endonuclease
MKNMYVYVLSNPKRMLYTGVTSDLRSRILQHKQKTTPGYTSRYNITELVYFEAGTGPLEAIAREKQIKGWLRSKKIALIESLNPEWRDLADDWE